MIYALPSPVRGEHYINLFYAFGCRPLSTYPHYIHELLGNFLSALTKVKAGRK